MRNLFILLLLILCTGSIVLSQPICSFDKVHKNRLEKDPSYKKAIEDNELNVQKYIAKNKNRISARTEATDAAALYTIPVVVHVMHTGGAVGSIYNPSDAQIQSAINYLNQVYNGTYPGTQGIGDIQIQFVLAVKDPNCNSIAGIERINASSVAGYSANGISTNPGVTSGVDELSIKNLSRWDTYQYYNIWIVNKIDGQDGTSGQFIAGYAYLPGISPTYDGIVMLATQMVSGQKTLPHEVGHAFGLLHPFQGSSDKNTCPANANCNVDNDRVCDTDPISFNQLEGVVDFSCRTGINTCTGTSYNDNTESNYMNYTYCYNLFTAGQKARMLAYAATQYRKSLTTSLASNPSSYLTASYLPPVAPSCTPSTSNAGLSSVAAGILNIDLNGQSLESFVTPYDNGYLNGTSSCLNMVQLVRGSAYTITVNVAGMNQEQIRAWIDFNNDGLFDNATEQILFNSSVTTASPIASASFVVPNTVPLNTMLRMRVIDDIATIYGAPSIATGCVNPIYGQAEDYPVYIVSGVLPITLSEFKGVLQNQKAVLSWNINSGQGLKDFEVEKSIDGINFQKIGVIQSVLQNSFYTYTDAYLSANNYYRLKINDVSGGYKFSGVALVRNHNTEGEFQVINNPFINTIEMRLPTSGSKIRLQLLNSSGVVVAERETTSSYGYIKWNLTQSLSKGHYIIKAVVDNKIFTTKLIKQ